MTAIQEDLFSESWRTRDPDTSRLAARANPIGRSELRRRVLEVHAAHKAGLTDDELAGLLPLWHSPSVGKRRTDLLKLKFVTDSGVRRPTWSGSPAVVWRITEAGLAEAGGLL